MFKSLFHTQLSQGGPRSNGDAKFVYVAECSGGESLIIALGREAGLGSGRIAEVGEPNCITTHDIPAFTSSNPDVFVPSSIPEYHRISIPSFSNSLCKRCGSSLFSILISTAFSTPQCSARASLQQSKQTRHQNKASIFNQHNTSWRPNRNPEGCTPRASFPT